MRTIHTIAASLGAVLCVAAVAGPAGAVPADSHHQADAWYAGKSTITGSRSDSQAGNATPKANVYVPPAGNATPKANVYVPPASLWPSTGASAVASAPAKGQPTIPAHDSSSSGFDWGSAAIGAATGVVAVMIAFGGAMVLRRRRRVQAAA
jgi:hypothetical protein